MSAQVVEPDDPVEIKPGITSGPIVMEDYKVEETEEDYDATGMGSVEEEMRDLPFANDLISETDYAVDEDGMELSSDLEAIAESSPADRIAGGDRLNLRGFPTPALRNSFIQVGMPETLNTSQTIVIQGPLIPVLGRGAPGGIRNYVTARPKSKAQSRLSSSFSNLDRQRVNLEATSPLIPKKLWQRVAVEWQRRGGPEEFAVEETQGVSAALIWRQSRSTSASLAVDLLQVTAQASPGIPNYRIDAAHLIAGPYLPLAEFNANGPAAGVRRRSAAASLQIDTQPSKALALRASLEGWQRNVEQDRYTTPVLNLETGLFEGMREPRHLEQPQQAVALRLEGTYRFQALRGDHKLLASASGTRGEYRREDRALNRTARDALPVDVRHFNPHAPNYLLPPYNPELYGRITTDRTERADYLSVELSDRVAWRNGQTVLTAGLRLDEVSLVVEDHKPDATRPLIKDRTQQLSYQSALNFQVVPRRLLAFASVSTAFDPSTPVDVRTGRIQDNETTLGYESGVRGRAQASRLDYSFAGFLLYNRQISRRNPLYNDPIADANQTQPQLVAAGEERFTGARLDVKWAASPTLQLSLKSSYTRALTTASPDIPQEVGRPISRLPALKLNLALRHRPSALTNGPTWGAGWQYLSNYVANYADSRRDYLAYPGYGIVQISTGYQWHVGKRRLDLETGVRNLFDRDLLASNARVGAGREITISARMIF